jgi:hypothetical protein
MNVRQGTKTYRRRSYRRCYHKYDFALFHVHNKVLDLTEPLNFWPLTFQHNASITFATYRPSIHYENEVVPAPSFLHRLWCFKLQQNEVSRCFKEAMRYVFQLHSHRVSIAQTGVLVSANTARRVSKHIVCPCMPTVHIGLIILCAPWSAALLTIN